MPPTNSPTLRQRRLGTELRKLREHAGLTSTEAAQRLGLQQARLSMIEAGRYPVSADRVHAIALTYTCPDDSHVGALAAMTGRRVRGWWDEYRDHLPPDLIDLAELEYHATALRVALAIHIPALLQTPDHTRAMLREAVPTFRPHEIEHRLSHRIKRQTALHRDNPPPYTALLHEAALHIQYGGPNIARAQLSHLLDLNEEDHITIRIIPYSCSGFPGNGQTINYVHGTTPHLDTVQLDTHHGCDFLDAQAQLTKYRTILDRMEAVALEPSASRHLITNIIRSL
ncbi:helix-turn-helix domain-containing protein [Streptomyces dysideae]|uniref:DNA-binding protein n=1 Tax=Streptomyces dysideae TaxID=909626 RepID=A0A117S183_9ACTN|nr:helix-turn-helix transcriptional regulator [Streptomyces dysideae]KUO20732.1 DNA-binding protein [Streptomyces dysideae]